jgi:hypothetical protein
MKKQVIGGVVVVGFAVLAWSTRSPTQQQATVASPTATQTTAAVHARRAPALTIAKPHAAATPIAFSAPTLVAKDRSAWRLHELVDFDAHTDVHAKTADGRDLIIADPDHALVVQRDAGDLYVAWLVPNVAANDPRPLADLEAPAARIEGVSELSTSAQPAAVARPTGPAAIAITIDGRAKTTLTAATFAALATTRIAHKQDQVLAIELDKAFGHAALVAVEANGAAVEAEAPAPNARPVIFMNRRARFNFAWVDAAGKPVGAKHHEVTLVALRTR